MADKVRCPACRGSKKIYGLGGIQIDCRTCNGEGQILAVDKVVPEIAPVDNNSAIIKQVSDCKPVSTDIVEPEEKAVKVQGKRAIYKRKTQKG